MLSTAGIRRINLYYSVRELMEAAGPEAYEAAIRAASEQDDVDSLLMEEWNTDALEAAEEALRGYTREKGREPVARAPHHFGIRVGSKTYLNRGEILDRYEELCLRSYRCSDEEAEERAALGRWLDEDDRRAILEAYR